MDILRIPRKGMNPGAFSNDLVCPFCYGKKWSFVENVTPFRLRYRCKSCHKTVQYDISNRPDHPYAPFKNSFFKRIVEKSKQPAM